MAAALRCGDIIITVFVPSLVACRRSYGGAGLPRGRVLAVCGAQRSLGEPPHPCSRSLSLHLTPQPPQKLEAAGFHTRGDLENIGPVDLARGASQMPPLAPRLLTPRHAAEAELTHEEALGVLRETNSRLVAQAAALPGALTAPALSRALFLSHARPPYRSAHHGAGVAPGGACAAPHRDSVRGAGHAPGRWRGSGRNH